MKCTYTIVSRHTYFFNSHPLPLPLHCTYVMTRHDITRHDMADATRNGWIPTIPHSGATRTTYRWCDCLSLYMNETQRILSVILCLTMQLTVSVYCCNDRDSSSRHLIECSGDAFLRPLSSTLSPSLQACVALNICTASISSSQLFPLILFLYFPWPFLLLLLPLLPSLSAFFLIVIGASAEQGERHQGADPRSVWESWSGSVREHSARHRCYLQSTLFGVLLQHFKTVKKWGL